MRTALRVLASAAVVAAAALSGCGEVELQDVEVDGSGALPAPLASRWASQVADGSGARVTISPQGSAAALRALEAGSSRIAIVAEPLDLRNAGEGDAASVHVPLVLSSIAFAYRIRTRKLPRDEFVANGLEFETSLLAVMLRARIWSWENSRIVWRNPDRREVPDEVVQICYRSDPAAATAAFTGYMSRRSAWWREGPGSGERVVLDEVRSRKLPTIFRARGDRGMVRCMQRTEAAIGWLDAADVRGEGMSVARVVNREGRFVAPTVAGAQAAAAAVEVPGDLRFSLLDAPGEASYPITSVRFAIVPHDLCAAGAEPDEARAVRAWLEHALGDEGQATARRLGYAPLPERLRAAAEEQVDGLQCDGEGIE